jgi:hypothetical protein
MGAGPDAAVHHGEQHAALLQRLDHFFAGDAGAVGVEENQVGFGLLHIDPGDLRQTPRQRPGVGVIVRQPVDVVVERVNAGGGANAGLPHRAAKPLLPAPDLVDETARAGDGSADRGAEAFGEIEPGGIPPHRHIAGADA